jgi:SAM-dependent methyltransferase
MEKEKSIECCTTSCDIPLNQDYWNNQYKSNETGWDLGKVSPPIKSFFDSLYDKNLKILIPGCGNSYEAEYLLEKGFTSVTVIDIAPALVDKLRNKFEDNKNITIIHGDFFNLSDTFDIIVEQTFFCALPPYLRKMYVWKMHQLLNKNGLLVGLLFNRTFEKNPPFGGSRKEYELLFRASFDIIKLNDCENSITPRANTELWFEFKKNSNLTTNLYNLKGITCNECSSSMIKNLNQIEGIDNLSFSTDFKQLLLVSSTEIPIAILNNHLAYDSKLKIEEIIK